MIQNTRPETERRRSPRERLLRLVLDARSPADTEQCGTRNGDPRCEQARSPRRSLFRADGRVSRSQRPALRVHAGRAVRLCEKSGNTRNRVRRPQGLPVDVAIGMAQDAAAVICDRSYMPLQTGWRERLAGEAGCTVVQVETEVVVPVDVVSGKSEYAARTIRPKIQRVWDEYLVPLDETRPRPPPTESTLRETSTFPIRRQRWQPST